MMCDFGNDDGNNGDKKLGGYKCQRKRVKVRARAAAAAVRAAAKAKAAQRRKVSSSA